MTYQSARSIQIKEDNGQVHKFTQSEVDARGIRLYMGDSPIRVSQLNPGDKITATIVTEGKPEILTAQEVDAQLAAEAAPTEAARPAPGAGTGTQPKRRRQPRPRNRLLRSRKRRNRRPPEEAAPAPEVPKPYFKNPYFMLLVLIIIVALIWVLMRRRVKDKK